MNPGGLPGEARAARNRFVSQHSVLASTRTGQSWIVLSMWTHSVHEEAPGIR